MIDRTALIKLLEAPLVPPEFQREPEPDVVLVLARHHAQFVEWCRENGRNPNDRRHTIYGGSPSAVHGYRVDRLEVLDGFWTYHSQADEIYESARTCLWPRR